MSEWISVKDRLPNINDDGCYVIATSNGIVEQVCFYDGEFRLFRNNMFRTCVVSGGRVLKNISHWMPLPEPPKGQIK